jgi:Family of unknown function (DUF6734)
VEWEYVQSKDTLLTAENCGILGGNNCKFLRYYSKKAMDLVLQRRYAAAWRRLPDKKPYTIVIEQFFLSACVEFHRYHPKLPVHCPDKCLSQWLEFSCLWPSCIR